LPGACAGVDDSAIAAVAVAFVVRDATSGTTKISIDVLVDRAAGGSPFKPFGTWAITF